jgi:AraC-like DNA-binding protein
VASRSDKPVLKPALWVTFLIILSLTFLFSSVTVTFMPRNYVFTSLYAVIAMVVVSGQNILLSFHIIRRKYLLYAVYTEPEVAVEAETEAIAEQKEKHSFHAGKLTRRRLNTYFREKKPYMQADYKITDLVEAMDVNRSVLSAFINRTYGVNFNRFINQWRLKELERLQQSPLNKGKNVSELVAKAGFTNLRHYFRAKNQLRITKYE